MPARLLVGPWTHLDIGSQGGVAMTESLAWLDRYAGPGRTGPRAPASSEGVRIWVGGTGAGEWRETGTWPPPGAVTQRWYLGAHGSLSLTAPGPGIPGRPDVPAARFRYDPADPTPSPGGATLSVRAGSRDNRAVERRPDVLVFSSDPLGGPAEVIGEVAAELSVTRDNPYADLFVRLCDVDPRGRSRNVCDGVVRLTAADPLTGTVRVSLLGAAHRFGRGHRIRLQVAGGRTPGSPATRGTASSTRPPPAWCRRGTRSAWTRRAPRRCSCP